MSYPPASVSRTITRAAFGDGVTLALLSENRAPQLAGAVWSALRITAHLRARGIATEVLVVDNASQDGSLPLARQIEALHYADGVRLVAFARRQRAAGIRDYAAYHATYRYVLPVLAGTALDADQVDALYETMVAVRAAVVYGHPAVREPRFDDLFPRAGGPERAPDLLASDGSPCIALLDRVQVLDAGGYRDMPGDESAVDRECYAHLRACGRRVVFVPLVSGQVDDPR